MAVGPPLPPPALVAPAPGATVATVALQVAWRTAPRNARTVEVEFSRDGARRATGRLAKPTGKVRVPAAAKLALLPFLRDGAYFVSARSLLGARASKWTRPVATTIVTRPQPVQPGPQARHTALAPFLAWTPLQSATRFVITLVGPGGKRSQRTVRANRLAKPGVGELTNGAIALPMPQPTTAPTTQPPPGTTTPAPGGTSTSTTPAPGTTTTKTTTTNSGTTTTTAPPATAQRAAATTTATARSTTTAPAPTTTAATTTAPSTLAAPADPPLDGITAFQGYQWPATLPPGAYTWSVRGYRVRRSKTRPTDTIPFTLTSTIVPTEPRPGGTVFATAKFAWPALPGAKDYELRVGPKPPIPGAKAGEEGWTNRYTTAEPTFSVAVPETARQPNGTFYWQVVGRDAAGVAGSPSSVRKAYQYLATATTITGTKSGGKFVVKGNVTLAQRGKVKLYQAPDGAPSYAELATVNLRKGTFATTWTPPSPRRLTHFIAIFQGNPRYAPSRSNVVDYAP